MLEMFEETTKKRGSATREIIHAIQNDYTTLRAIADHTNMPYRDVNAIVTSLELQDRVIALDYKVKRGNQQFKVVRAEKQRARNRGAVEHPRHRLNLDDLNKIQTMHNIWHTIPPHIPMSTQFAGTVRVHRIA